jgi:hypothetical protein
VKHPSKWTYGDPAFHEVMANDERRDPKLHAFRDDSGGDTELHNLGHFQYVYLARDTACWIDWPARMAEIRRGQWGTVDRGEVIAQLRKLESQEQLVAWCKMVTLMLKD